MNDDLLRELLVTSKGMAAPPREVPTELKERFEAALSQYCVKAQVLSEAQMNILILKILNNGRADGGEVADELERLKVHLATPGEGLIFAVLARMEDVGTISGQFNNEMTKKTYSLTPDGSALLKRKASAVQNINPLVAALWAV